MKFLKRYFGQLFEPAEAKTLKDESISSILEKGLSPWRSHLLCGLITFSFILLFGRLVYLQLGFNTDFLQKQGNIRFQRTVEMPGNARTDFGSQRVCPGFQRPCSVYLDDPSGHQSNRCTAQRACETVGNQTIGIEDKGG